MQNSVEWLLVTVGGTTEPIEISIEENKPAKVLFIGTQQSEKTIKKIIKKFDMESNDYEKLIIENPDDPDEILQKIIVFCREIKVGDCMVDPTGGTKSMSMALAFYSLEEEGSRCGLVTGFRGDAKKISSGSYFKEIKFGRLTIRKKIREVEEELGGYRFSSAVEKLKSVAKSNALSAAEASSINSLIVLLHAYHLWDAGLFSEALDKLEQNHIPQFSPEKRAYFQSVCTAVDILRPEVTSGSSRITNPLLLVKELLQSARRRSERGLLDEAVARIYRAIEATGQAGLISVTGEYSNNFPYEMIPKNLREDWKLAPSKKKQLGLMKIYHLLSVLEPDSKLGKNWENYKKRLKNWIQARNKSFLAHGFEPVDEQAVQDGFEMAEELLKNFNQDFSIEGKLLTAEQLDLKETIGDLVLKKSE